MEDIQNVMTQIRPSLGNVPLVDGELERFSGDGKEEKDDTVQQIVAKLVTADGNYATQSAFSTKLSTKKNKTKVYFRPPLRSYMLQGNFFVGAALATTLTTLALRDLYFSRDKRNQNSFVAESMLIMTTLIHLEKSGLAKKNITDDDVDRFCLKILFDRSPLIDIFNQECRKSLSAMLEVKEAEEQLMIPFSLCNWLRRLM